jgi:hypothetical protein
MTCLDKKRRAPYQPVGPKGTMTEKGEALWKDELGVDNASGVMVWSTWVHPEKMGLRRCCVDRG